ncbi:MAG: N6-L-threonylcarbamoyladenine synthase [Planctomycetota bacterium]|jgi:N6-L-threonylcarbamoyladenine synthase
MSEDLTASEQKIGHFGPDALVLGIESSCDETAAAVLRGGREVLSSVIDSQADEHAAFGGVVPEVAGRSHLRSIQPVIERALADADVELDQLSGIAVTHRPGLIGSLLVGLCAAKGLAFGRDLPLVGVHHIQAHAWAATMELPPREALELPAIALVVSGGHTALYRMDGPARMTQIGTTLDDAAGEAFDKVASMLGLRYPGGPSVSKLAAEGNPASIAFPRYQPKDGKPGFSFSGLKTAVLYHLRGQNALNPTPAPEDIEHPADVAASFQEAVVDALVKQTLQAAKDSQLKSVIVAGGVACNARLRERMLTETAARGIRAVFPSPAYCTDNAVMIAGLGHELLSEGLRHSWDLDALAR